MQCHYCALTHEGEENECGGRLPHESAMYWAAFDRQDSFLLQLVGDMVRARVKAKLEFKRKNVEYAIEEYK